MSDGLEGVVAADTVLSEVDGAGRPPDRSAAARWTNWPAAPASRTSSRLLFDGFFDDLPGRLSRRAWAQARVEVFAEVAALDDRPAATATPIEAMRALTARLPDGDDLADRPAAAGRPRRCSPPPWCAPRPARRRSRPTRRSATPPTSCACCAARPRPTAEADALDTYLVTVGDHGLNASTFAARVVASTRAGLTSAVLAGISALKGPLHGGAPGPVIDMLDEIGEPGERPRLDRGGAGPRRPADGLRPPHLPGPRPPRRRPEGRRARLAAASTPCRAGWPSPRRWRRRRWPSCASASPTGRWTPMSSSTPRCCWRPWASRPPPSPASSPWAASPAGSPMPASSWPAAG